MTLQRLALSRSTLDRASHRRPDPGLVASLLSVPGTAVLVLVGDRAPITDGPDGPGLDLLDPVTATAAATRTNHGRSGAGDLVVSAYLGTDAAGRDHVLLAAPAPPGEPAAAGADALPGATRWAGLRTVGHLLDDTDAGMLACAVALANWHAVHVACPRCGGTTEPVQAGWARACPACGAEHYPRTDPAVIMAVVDAGDRILLGRQDRWPQRRYSTLAGFVEPGEDLEAAVRREVWEEARIRVDQVTYRGSQPWPFPSSLMVGFRAAATSTEVRVDGTELAEARWWSREELGLDVATGELVLPPSISIARRLVEDWYGGPISGVAEAWR